MGYSRGTLNYPKRIVLSYLTHMMSMLDLVAIGVETLRIYSGCSLEKEFIELIRMNPLNPLLSIRLIQVTVVSGPLTRDTKDVLWMDGCVLLMTYESLALGSLNHYILDTT